MFLSPYETTVCKSHRIDDIKRDVEQLKIEGELLRQSTRVFLVGPDSTQVKPFAHPIILGDKEPYIVADVRAAANIHRETGELRGGSDLNYIRNRASVISVTWLDNNRHDLLNAGDFQIKVFARLLSENLQRRMNLSIDTAIRIQIISAMYYLSLFEEEAITKGDETIKAGKRISRSIGIPLPQVLELIESLEPMHNLNDYCEMLKEHGSSVRLDRIAPAVVYTMLGGIWYGANNTENVAVALEHPPTFATMVYLAQSDRGYRKSILGQLVLGLSRRNDLATTFERHMKRIIESDQ